MPEQPTTPDRAALVRTSIEAVNRRDYDEAVALFSSDGVWDLSGLGLGVFAGHEAIRRFFEEWIEAYEDYGVALEEFSDLEAGVTLFVALQHGTPAGSTGVVELRYATVSTWVEGSIARSTIYTDIDEGRAAAERLAAAGRR